MALWIRLVVSLLGLVAFGALVWLAGPLLGFGAVRPFEPAWSRLTLVGVVWAIVLGFLVLDIVRRRRRARAMEQEIAQVDEGDKDVLDEKMRDALLTLKKASGSSANYLYEIPWYVIIGPPGSGKTTALVNSGLKFPLARGGKPASVAGVGGTRYCDWWFTDGAVLIDTAGRYTTQDSDAASDKKSWLHFLDGLKRNRPRQPINGVLIAISIEDILAASAAEINAHADAIRARLSELHESLKIDFPVYVLFTKMDLVAGFQEYFGNLNENDRRAVWGATFQPDEKTRNMIGEVPAEFEALVERINADMADRLQEEASPAARVQLFGFPSQMEALKTPVVEFMERIFEPTRYHSRATLRGFYFTSGTQQGTPIDQLIGAMARSFGANQFAASAMSGTGKSYFLTDLINEVVIGEAGWVSSDRGAVRRGMLASAAAYAVLALLTLATAGAWWWSYTHNSELVAETNAQTKSFVAQAAPVIQEPVVADRDLERIAPLLDQLRYLPAGYDENQRALQKASFGLGQWPRLNTGSEALYRTGLERLLLSRLIFRLEELIEANIGNPNFLYEAMKVYLIIGGRQTMDAELVLSWFGRDLLDNLYPGGANADLRASILSHTEALLDLSGDGAARALELNEPLIQEAQNALARLSLAERAYQILKVEARATAVRRDWVASERAGSDAAMVFTGKGGKALEDIRVPYFYTYDGFHEAFIGRLRDVALQVEEERWVLGEAGAQDVVSEQYATLPSDLLDLYQRDFVGAWNEALESVALQPLLTDKPRYPALSAVAAVTSPLRQILESIRDETRLTRERPTNGTGETGVGVEVTEAQQRLARRLAETTNLVSSTTFSRMDLALRAMEQPQTAGPGVRPPGETVEAAFRDFHLALEGDPGRRPIDQVLTSFQDVNRDLRLLATNPERVQQVNATLPSHIENLINNANLMPQPFAQMVEQAAADFERELTGASVSQLLQDLRSQVTAQCEQIVSNRYPFSRGSSRDVPLADFGRLLGPGGIIDRFFTEKLESLVDTTGPEWRFRQNISVARSLPASALKNFQLAAQIREAFFPLGGNMPSFTMMITPVVATGSSQMVTLDVSGIAVTPEAGGRPVAVVWPGPAGLERVALSVTTSTFFGGTSTTRGPELRGPWSFFRMLDSAATTRRGETLISTFRFSGMSATYEINVSALRNPLTLAALREFRCPGS